MTEPEIPENGGLGAFEPENFGPVIIIQMMRVYDLLLSLLASVDEEKAIKLSELHAAGFTLAPDPKFSMEE